MKPWASLANELALRGFDCAGKTNDQIVGAAADFLQDQRQQAEQAKQIVELAPALSEEQFIPVQPAVTKPKRAKKNREAI